MAPARSRGFLGARALQGAREERGDRFEVGAFGRVEVAGRVEVETQDAGESLLVAQGQRGGGAARAVGVVGGAVLSGGAGLGAVVVEADGRRGAPVGVEGAAALPQDGDGARVGALPEGARQQVEDVVDAGEVREAVGEREQGASAFLGDAAVVNVRAGADPALQPAVVGADGAQVVPAVLAVVAAQAQFAAQAGVAGGGVAPAFEQVGVVVGVDVVEEASGGAVAGTQADVGGPGAVDVDEGAVVVGDPDEDAQGVVERSELLVGRVGQHASPRRASSRTKESLRENRHERKAMSGT
nr:hypothetical protein [Deinococcus pimensis]